MAQRPGNPRPGDPAWDGVTVDPEHLEQLDQDWQREDVRVAAVEMARKKGARIDDEADLETALQVLEPAEAAALSMELPDVRS